MNPTIHLVSESTAPLLDHVGVELARRRHVMWHRLVTEQPSVDYGLLAAARGQTEAAARQWVRRLRNEGKLITVDHSGTLIPSFQFDSDYEPIPAVADAVQTLTGSGMSGWAVWHWFSSVSPWVGFEPVLLIEQGRGEHLIGLAEQFVADSTAG